MNAEQKRHLVQITAMQDQWLAYQWEQMRANLDRNEEGVFAVLRDVLTLYGNMERSGDPRLMLAGTMGKAGVAAAYDKIAQWANEADGRGRNPDELTR